MIKYTTYRSKNLVSMEIDGRPYADMERILDSIIKGAWPDYQQVLNSDEDMQIDLDVKYIDGRYWINVEKVSAWLFSFSLKNMKNSMYETFRMYRRDVEKALRVTWAMPVEDLIVTDRGYYMDCQPEYGIMTIHDLANIFSSYGVPDCHLEGVIDEGVAFGPLHYIEYIAGSTACGPRGYMLCEMIQYIEEMPMGSAIFDYINSALIHEIPQPPEGEFLDDYLDGLNVFIAYMASRFVGE